MSFGPKSGSITDAKIQIAVEIIVVGLVCQMLKI